jgi:hypothetical protein
MDIYYCGKQKDPRASLLNATHVCGSSDDIYVVMFIELNNVAPLLSSRVS